MEKPIVLGRVSGFRGRGGEITVKVFSGEAARWEHLTRVVLGGAESGVRTVVREVAAARAYRDRLVLKLVGIDDANEAAAFRGCDVSAAAGDVPALPDDVYWVTRLVGARVKDAALGDLGQVKDVVPTGGIDLLVVTDADGVETLIPLAKAFVRRVDEAAGTIDVALPEGLRGLNAGDGRETA